MAQYHDIEWGMPTWDDRILFEFLVLESAQAGLSWSTILQKRAAYRTAFARFNPVSVARFTRSDVTRLLKNPGIVRNRLKVESAITNARLFLILQEEYGSFGYYLSAIIGRDQTDGKRRTPKGIPATTSAAHTLSDDMRHRGFKFFGPTIAYAFLQAVGRVNDHTRDCFRYQEIKTLLKDAS